MTTIEDLLNRVTQLEKQVALLISGRDIPNEAERFADATIEEMEVDNKFNEIVDALRGYSIKVPDEDGGLRLHTFVFDMNTGTGELFCSTCNVKITDCGATEESWYCIQNDTESL